MASSFKRAICNCHKLLQHSRGSPRGDLVDQIIITERDKGSHQVSSWFWLTTRLVSKTLQSIADCRWQVRSGEALYSRPQLLLPYAPHSPHSTLAPRPSSRPLQPAWQWRCVTMASTSWSSTPPLSPPGQFTVLGKALITCEHSGCSSLLWW